MYVPEVRTPRDDDEMRRIWAMLCRVFGWKPDDFDRFASGSPIDRVLAVFVDDDPVACARIRSFGQFFGGRRVAMGGFSPVGVSAEHRGQGYGSLVTAAHFPRLRDEGEVISGLYPATTSLYRKVGFELAGVWGILAIRTRELQRVPAARGLPVRRAGENDFGAVEACYARVARSTPGFLDRSRPWWDRILLGDPEQQIYVVDGDDGQVDGYVRYKVRARPNMNESSIDVAECIASTTDVMHALWRLVGSSSSIAPNARLTGPPEHPLLFSLPEQEELTASDEWRWMTRIIDAPGAIAARGYPPGARGQVDLRLLDPQCDWNDGRWRLEIDDGEGRLVRGGDGDVEMGVGAFSSLYTGYVAARSLATAGLARGASDRTLDQLDAAFAGPTPWMPDFF